MDIFQVFKDELLRRAKEKDACASQYARACSAGNVNDLLTVVKENFRWCWHRSVVDAEMLAKIPEAVLMENQIYLSGRHEISVSTNISVVLLADAQATVETCGSSQATVETWGSSQATVETCGSSQATVKTWGSSQATVKTWGSSQATVETWGSSRATVKTLGSSQATVETWGSSQATVETWGSSQATVKTWGSSQATVKTLGSSQATVETWGSSIVRNISTRKIYIKKSEWEIVEYE